MREYAHICSGLHLIKLVPDDAPASEDWRICVL